MFSSFFLFLTDFKINCNCKSIFADCHNTKYIFSTIKFVFAAALEKLILSIIKPKQLDKHVAIKYGRDHEAVAMKKLEQLHRVKVRRKHDITSKLLNHALVV